MTVNLIFKIAAVGILVSLLCQLLKNSGRDDLGHLVSLAGLLLVLFWVLPYVLELFDTMDQIGKIRIRNLDYSDVRHNSWNVLYWEAGNDGFRTAVFAVLFFGLRSLYQTAFKGFGNYLSFGNFGEFV